MSNRTTSIESIHNRIQKAVDSGETNEQHRLKLAELLALAWNASRTSVTAEA